MMYLVFHHTLVSGGIAVKPHYVDVDTGYYRDEWGFGRLAN